MFHCQAAWNYDCNNTATIIALFYYDGLPGYLQFGVVINNSARSILIKGLLKYTEHTSLGHCPGTDIWITPS